MAHVTSIGLDVHARSIKGCAFNPFTGEVERKTFGYEPAEVASWILSFEAPKAVYESGVTGFHLQRELASLGVKYLPELFKPDVQLKLPELPLKF